MKLELKVIDLLKNKKLTMNEIAKALKQHYSLVHRTINKLNNIIKKKQIGKAHLCSLNLKNEKTITLLTLSEIEKKEEFLEKNKQLNLILEDFLKNNDFISVVLFGSYAKHSEKKTSDIDLLVIVNKKFPVEKEVKEIYAKYGKELNLIILTLKEIKEQKNKEFMKEIIDNHYIIKGTENFINLIYK